MVTRVIEIARVLDLFINLGQNWRRFLEFSGRLGDLTADRIRLAIQVSPASTLVGFQ